MVIVYVAAAATAATTGRCSEGVFSFWMPGRAEGGGGGGVCVCVCARARVCVETEREGYLFEVSPHTDECTPLNECVRVCACVRVSCVFVPASLPLARHLRAGQQQTQEKVQIYTDKPCALHRAPHH